MHTLLKRMKQFWKRETVLCAAALAAAVSACFVPPSGNYWSYIDFRVLALLFCLMLVVAAMRKIGVFEVLANRILGRAETMLGLGAALVFLCFFFSMVVTNDVALLTFVPFSFRVLELAGRQDKLIAVIVLQTAAANLGSMLTPVGNPQNLYLYSTFGMEIEEFLDVTTPLTTLSAGLLALSCFLLLDRRKTGSTSVWKQEPGELELFERELNAPEKRQNENGIRPASDNGPRRANYETEIRIQPFNNDGLQSADHGAEMQLKDETGIRQEDRGKLLLYIGLFLLCLLTVMRILPWQALLAVIVMSVGVVDRSLFRTADYGLLLTFVCFFLFVGNAAAVPQISKTISELLADREILTSTLASQVISNVPAAVLLSGFTDNVRGLLAGVNVGGLGTLIASLASLISYKQYVRLPQAKPGRYLLEFTLVNAAFLAVLLPFALAVFGR